MSVSSYGDFENMPVIAKRGAKKQGQSKKKTTKTNITPKNRGYEVVPQRPVERVAYPVDPMEAMGEDEFAERSWENDEVQVVESRPWTDRPNQARSRLRNRRRVLEVDLVHTKDPVTGKHITRMALTWWAQNHENRITADSPVAYKNALWNIVLDHTHWLEYDGPQAIEDHEDDRQLLVEEMSRMIESGQLDLDEEDEP